MDGEYGWDGQGGSLTYPSAHMNQHEAETIPINPSLALPDLGTQPSKPADDVQTPPLTIPHNHHHRPT